MALLQEHIGPGVYANDFPGYDLLMMINLRNAPMTTPQVGVGEAGFLTNLEQEGFSNDPLFGGSGPVTLTQLAATRFMPPLSPSDRRTST